MKLSILVAADIGSFFICFLEDATMMQSCDNIKMDNGRIGRKNE